ncbi:hypothetical protein D9M72_239190 [compost metagenome]
MDRAEPYQRSERPPQPDCRADQGRRLGVPHQPQRHRLHGVEPGGHALAGGIEPFAVGQAVQAGHQQPAGALQPGQRFPDSAVRRIHLRTARDLWRQRLQGRHRRRARPHGQRGPLRSRRGTRRGAGRRRRAAVGEQRRQGHAVRAQGAERGPHLGARRPGHPGGRRKHLPEDAVRAGPERAPRPGCERVGRARLGLHRRPGAGRTQPVAGLCRRQLRCRSARCRHARDGRARQGRRLRGGQHRHRAG